MRATLIALSVLCLSQAQAYTLPQNSIKSYECSVCAQLPHESLQDSWSITEVPFKKTSSNIQKSFSYYQKVTAEQLHQGVTLFTHAPGAVVRITPLQNKTVPALEFKTAQNQFMDLEEASSLFSKDEAFSESLMPLQHQTMLQIKPDLGFGRFIIKSKTQDVSDANSYMIHVYEKYALIYLQIEPSALQFQYGDKFTATITLKDNENSYSVDDINARLKGPENQIIPVRLKQVKRNQFQASSTMISELNSRGDNWYIEVDVVTDQDDAPVHRTGRAAFSYSIPSASLVSITKLSSKPLTFSATVDVATSSRYGLQTVLFRKNSAGKTVPIATSQNAQWLSAGKQTIKFSFDNSTQLAEDQLAVGYLHLTDYGQLKTVYQYNDPIKLSELME